MRSNTLNELDGKTWLQNSFSIWRDLKKTKEEVSFKHPAMFPSALCAKIINTFTKKGDLVLDPFMGIGSTILAAAEQSRKAVGIELSENYYITSKARIKKIIVENSLDSKSFSLINDDSNNMLKYIKPNSVNLCFTSPPYWDILNMNRSADMKKTRNYSNSKNDLGNLNDYDDFLNKLMKIFENVYKVLIPKGFCVINVMDIRKKDKFYPFHSDVAYKMRDIGFSFEDIIIWDRQNDYNNMRPLGYPFVLRVNKVHEYLLIFRKI